MVFVRILGVDKFLVSLNIKPRDMSRKLLLLRVASQLGTLLQHALTPLFFKWKPEIPGHCLNAGLVATVLGAFNVVADFATVFMPLPMIWNLHMQRKWKMQLIGIFLLSGLYVALIMMWNLR